MEITFLSASFAAMKYLLLPLLITGCTTLVSGQTNIGVRMDLGINSDDALEEFSSNFVNESGDAESFYDPLQFSATLGLTYRHDFSGFGIETGLGFEIARNKAEREVSGVTEAYKFSGSHLSASFGPILGRNKGFDFAPKFYFINYRTRIDQTLGSDENDLGLRINQWIPGVEVAFSYHLPGNKNSHLAIRPFARFDLAPIDYDDTGKTLSVSTPVDASRAVYGVSFILYNGPQLK